MNTIADYPSSHQQPPLTLAILILAAGSSSRLGQAKQLVDFGGQPLLQRQIQLAAKICPTVYCVLGCQADHIISQLNSYSMNASTKFIINHRWQNGMGHSLAVGIDQLPAKTAAVLVLLADQWAIQSQDLTLLTEQWQQQPDKIHCGLYRQQIGVPAIFPAAFFPQLQQLGQGTTANNGAKQLLQQQQRRQHVVCHTMDNAAIDLDVPVDLITLQQHLATKANSS